MLFKSPHANLEVKCRSAIVKRHPVMGDIIETRPAVRAEFGRFGAEQPVHNPLTGETDMFAEVVGHFYETDEWLERRLQDVPPEDEETIKWMKEEHELMNRVLLRKCRELPGMIQLVVPHQVPFPKPWLTYDEQTPEAIVDNAQLLEMVAQTVAYERTTLARPAILDILEAVLEEAGETVPDAAWEFAPEDLEMPSGREGVVLGQAQQRLSPYGMMAPPPAGLHLG
jgi:hypothetical protein